MGEVISAVDFFTSICALILEILLDMHMCIHNNNTACTASKETSLS